MKSISLVKKPHDSGNLCSPCCSPGDYGTRVYLSGPKGLAEIPEEGTITFKFERRSLTLATGENEGDPVRVELKLLSIESAKEEDVSDAKPAESAKEEDAGSALDKLVEVLRDEIED